MRYIVAISPSELNNTSIFSHYENITPAHTGFVVKRDGHLYSAHRNSGVIGGLMFITFETDTRRQFYERLAGEISFVYRKKGFTGIVVNGPSNIKVDNLLGVLYKRLTKNIYLASEINSSSECCRIVSSAISGGTLRELLQSQIGRYGLEKTAFAAELVRSDFELPAFSGTGKTLTLNETISLIEKYKTPSFYSSDLETNYFNYQTDNKAHIVLYDNSESMRKKIALAASLGISVCFLSYCDTKHIIENIIC